MGNFKFLNILALALLASCQSNTSTTNDDVSDQIQPTSKYTNKPASPTAKKSTLTNQILTPTAVTNVEVPVVVYSELADKISEVMKREEIMPGYPNSYGIKTLKLPKLAAVQKNIEWSYKFINDVALELGFDNELILGERDGERSLEYTSTFTMAKKLINSVSSNINDIEEVSYIEAGHRVQKGELVIFVANFNASKEVATIGLVYPGEEIGEELQLAIVTPTVGIISHKELKVVPRFFSIPKKEQFSLGEVDKVAGTRLNRKIQSIISRTELMPGYPTWDGLNVRGLPAKPGAEPGVTWCQVAAYRIATELGYLATPLIGSGRIEWVNADTIYNNLRFNSSSGLYGVLEIDAEEAQRLANKGELVILAAHSHLYDSSGHVGVVAMTDRLYNPKIGPLIGQAGAVNGYFNYRTWIADWKMEPHFFHLTKKAR